MAVAARMPVERLRRDSRPKRLRVRLPAHLQEFLREHLQRRREEPRGVLRQSLRFREELLLARATPRVSPAGPGFPPADVVQQRPRAPPQAAGGGGGGGPTGDTRVTNNSRSGMLCGKSKGTRMTVTIKKPWKITDPITDGFWYLSFSGKVAGNSLKMIASDMTTLQRPPRSVLRVPAGEWVF